MCGQGINIFWTIINDYDLKNKLIAWCRNLYAIKKNINSKKHWTLNLILFVQEKLAKK